MRIYQAKSHSRSFVPTLRAMFSELRMKSYVGYRLFAKDIRAEYSRTLGGVLWDFVEPLAFVVVFIFLKKSQTLTVQDLELPYPLFITIGMLLWKVFNDSVKFPLSILQKSKPILKNMNIPPETLMFSAFYKLCFNAFFGLVVIDVICFYYGVYSLRGLLLAPLFTLVLIVIGTSIGFLMAPFNVIYNDVGKLINIILRPMMFISGTIFPISTHGGFGFLHSCNPVLVSIENLRMLITSGAIPTSIVFWNFTLGGACLYLVAWYFFHVAFRMISDKL